MDADDCPGGGELAAEPACRETVVEAFRDRDAAVVVTRAAGVDRRYEDDSAALLVAAGRFAERIAVHDERLAERTLTEPLAAARASSGRAGAVARVAAESGLAAATTSFDDYDDALRPRVAPTVAREQVTARPPSDARLVDRYDLDRGAVVRRYERPDDDLRTYHLTPVELTFDGESTAALAAAASRLAMGVFDGRRAAVRAVRSVAGDAASGSDLPVEAVTDALEKHTRGLGTLDDLFADPAVSDAHVSAPAAASPVRVEADGETMRTNVRLTEQSAAALASRLRRESGRPFSRAAPSLDATLAAADRELRVAAVTDPLSDGHGFAFRAHDADRFDLPELVANGTLRPAAAALLSLAVERGAAVLAAGGRGAGKTTLLGALLSELPVETRTVVIEDTPELPVDRGGETVGPAEALRTALRLGEGALVVGEVRGEEAGALYEAMRVGSGGATLGTVHGDGPEAVRERVVTDLGVPASSFADTDLVVTLERGADGDRCVAAVDEVVGRAEASFASLFEQTASGLDPTGRIDRGNSELLAALARPAETYADVREALSDREAALG